MVLMDLERNVCALFRSTVPPFALALVEKLGAAAFVGFTFEECAFYLLKF